MKRAKGNSFDFPYWVTFPAWNTQVNIYLGDFNNECN